MNDTSNPSPDGGDVLAVMDSQHACFIRAGRYNGREGCWFNRGEDETLKAEYARIRTAVAALISRNAELEAERDSLRRMFEQAAKEYADHRRANEAERNAIAAENKGLRETLAIVKANAFKTAPLPGYPATGAQWLIGFATDNGSLSFDQVFDNAIALARTPAATGDQHE